MKQGSYVYLALLLMFLLISHSNSARILKDNENQGSGSGSGSASSMAATMEEEEDLATLMGSEECNGNEEACVIRRMIADAHLDYIYTQHHKPKGSP